MNEENRPDCTKCVHFIPYSNPEIADAIYGFIAGWCLCPTCKGYVQNTWMAPICRDYKEKEWET